MSDRRRVVYFNNCQNRPHAQIFGAGAFFDLDCSGPNSNKARDLPQEQLCIVVETAAGNELLLTWYRLEVEKPGVDPESAPGFERKRVFYGRQVYREALPRVRAAQQVCYAHFFRRDQATSERTGRLKLGSVFDVELAEKDLPEQVAQEVGSADVGLVSRVSGVESAADQRLRRRLASGVEYDIALSFAGEDRAYVEQVADKLRERGIRVFYDRYEEATLWGRDLYVHLHKVYAESALFTVIFVSVAYSRKLWTNHERSAAQSRAFKEKREYLLPARFDQTVIPGLPDTTGYVDLSQKTPYDLADLIAKKVDGLDVQQSQLRDLPPNLAVADAVLRQAVPPAPASTERVGPRYARSVTMIASLTAIGLLVAAAILYRTWSFEPANFAGRWNLHFDFEGDTTNVDDPPRPWFTWQAYFTQVGDDVSGVLRFEAPGNSQSGEVRGKVVNHELRGDVRFNWDQREWWRSFYLKMARDGQTATGSAVWEKRDKSGTHIYEVKGERVRNASFFGLVLTGGGIATLLLTFLARKRLRKLFRETASFRRAARTCGSLIGGGPGRHRDQPDEATRKLHFAEQTHWTSPSRQPR